MSLHFILEEQNQYGKILCVKVVQSKERSGWAGMKKLNRANKFNVIINLFSQLICSFPQVSLPLSPACPDQASDGRLDVISALPCFPTDCFPF